MVNLPSNLEVRDSIPVFSPAGRLLPAGLTAAQCSLCEDCARFPRGEQGLLLGTLQSITCGHGCSLAGVPRMHSQLRKNMDRNHHRPPLMRLRSVVLSVVTLFFFFPFTILCHRLAPIQGSRREREVESTHRHTWENVSE